MCFGSKEKQRSERCHVYCLTKEKGGCPQYANGGEPLNIRLRLNPFHSTYSFPCRPLAQPFSTLSLCLTLSHRRSLSEQQTPSINHQQRAPPSFFSTQGDMAELQSFHLANIIRMTQSPPSTRNNRRQENNQSYDSTVDNDQEHIQTDSDMSDASEEDDNDEGGQSVVLALTKVKQQWERNILDFKTMLASRQQRQREELLSSADFPPLEEEIEYGMEDAGYDYKTPAWPHYEDSDDTETVSDTESLLDHQRSDDNLIDHGSMPPPVLPPRHMDQAPSMRLGDHASSRSSVVIYDRSWLLKQCTAHIEAFGDPSIDMTPRRLAIDIFTILRSDKLGKTNILRSIRGASLIKRVAIVFVAPGYLLYIALSLTNLLHFIP